MRQLTAPLFVPHEFSVNTARALFDQDAYDEMPRVLRRAERSIRLEFFLFGGPVADEMIQILAAKQAKGICVRVTLDRALGLLPAVRRECRAAYRSLCRAGIPVVLSVARPLPNAPRRPLVHHNKIIVVDENEALVGGMNIGALFFRHHDVMIHLIGPAARDLARQFDFDRQFAENPRWIRPAETVSTLPPPLPTKDSANTDQTWARILGTGVGRRTTQAAIQKNLRAARLSVDILMSEIGRTDVLDDVIRAHRRGVQVRVLLDPQDMTEYLPPQLGDLRRCWPKTVLNALAIQILLRAQIPVRLFRVGASEKFALLHMKLALFDQKSAIVGSTNWTRGGFEWVGETDVELHGGVVIEQLKKQFESDWSAAAPAFSPSRTQRVLCRLYERFVQ